jgi:hypothetical protein
MGSDTGDSRRKILVLFLFLAVEFATALSVLVLFARTSLDPCPTSRVEPSRAAQVDAVKAFRLKRAQTHLSWL